MCDIPPTYQSPQKGKINQAITALGKEISQAVNSIKSPTRRPYAKAHIYGRTVPCLFDTGADVSCINSKTLLLFPSDRKINMIEKVKPLRGAGGDSLKVHGSQTVELEIDGKTVKHPFLVIEDLNEPMILGIDFITRHGLNYSPLTREFSWEGQVNKWNQGFCSAIKTEKIAALSSKVIKVNLITTGGRKPSEKEVISACAASEQKLSQMSNYQEISPIRKTTNSATSAMFSTKSKNSR